MIKKILDLKPIGHAFTCHIGCIKSVHIFYCMCISKKKQIYFECVYESQIMSQFYRGWYTVFTSDPSIYWRLVEDTGGGEWCLSPGNSKVQYL